MFRTEPKPVLTRARIDEPSNPGRNQTSQNLLQSEELREETIMANTVGGFFLEPQNNIHIIEFVRCITFVKPSLHQIEGASAAVGELVVTFHPFAAGPIGEHRSTRREPADNSPKSPPFPIAVLSTLFDTHHNVLQ